MIKNLLLIIFTFTCFSLIAQTHMGDVLLRTQTEVNEFGANNYTRIEGDLQINGGDADDPDPITDLTPLNSLKEIIGKTQDHGLAIGELYGITGTLSGFENLETVTGTFSIYLQENESRFTAMDAFNKLKTVSFRFTISVNDALESIAGFNSLESVGEDFNITETPVLTSLQGFGKLKTIGGNFILEGMPLLKTFSGFESLESLTDLAIIENPELTTIPSFNNLKTLSKNLYIYTNPKLKVITGFNALEEVGTSGEGGFLAITGNKTLTKISGFNAIKKLPSLNILENTELKEIAGFEAWEDASLSSAENTDEMYFTISITANNKLEKIDALKNLKKCHIVSIDGIPLMKDLNFFCSLEEIVPVNGSDGLISIGAGSELTDCYALCNITSLKEYKVIINGGSGDCTDVVTFIGACDDASKSTCTTTSTSTLKNDARSKLYPNPTHGKVYLDTPYDNVSLRIQSITGKTIAYYPSFSQSTLDLSTYSKGIYIIHISHASNQYSEVFRISRH